MNTQEPSLYPTPEPQQAPSAPYIAAEHAPPPPPPPPQAGLSQHPLMEETPLQETLPPDYEVLLEVHARIIQEQPAGTMGYPPPISLSQPVSGPLRVIQGPMPPATPEQENGPPFYHSFLSVGNANIPLIPNCIASRLSPNSYRLILPSGTFIVEILPGTEPELVDAFERICRWFCQWDTVGEATSAAPSTTAPIGTLPSDAPIEGMEQPSIGRIGRAGEKGVQFVERMGSSLNKKINSALDKKLSAIQEGDQKQMKLGGKVTASVLTTTRKVVGVGAGAASKVTDKVSSMVGSAMSNNAVSRNMATAPEGSMKRSMYEKLMSGMVAVGRVYVAADQQGKIIIEDAGNRTSEIARRKYGDEAEMAARNISGIALDGYRISRFPQKLGATAILRGGLKASMASATHASNVSPTGSAAPLQQPASSYPASSYPGSMPGAMPGGAPGAPPGMPYGRPS